MVKGQAALTVADLCRENRIENNDEANIDDDYSTIGSIGENEDDSFVENNSLCKQHRTTLFLLDSLRKEVMEMVRSDDKSVTPVKSPQDVLIDMNNGIELASPLASPLLSRKLKSIADKDSSIQKLNDRRILLHKSDYGFMSYCTNNDDSTFCSMDNSINNEMNILKEAVKDLERELRTENLNTVFEAIERIEKNPTTDGLVELDDKDFIRERIRNELSERKKWMTPTFLKHTFFETIVEFLLSTENSSMHMKILMASIFCYLIRTYMFSWQDQGRDKDSFEA